MEKGEGTGWFIAFNLLEPFIDEPIKQFSSLYFLGWTEYGRKGSNQTSWSKCADLEEKMFYFNSTNAGKTSLNVIRSMRECSESTWTQDQDSLGRVACDITDT